MRFEDDKRKFAIYSRKSKFTGKGESIANQIELCKRYIQTHNENVRDEDIILFEDEGFSGSNVKRPQFQLMMSELRNKKIKAVVCYRLDRISRKISDFSSMIDEFAEYDVAFVSIKEQFDTSSSMGKAMMYISSVFAQLERETIAERIRDNMHELARTGRWLGGVPPTGYTSIPIVGSVTVDGKPRKAYKLDLIKNEAALVKQLFEVFLETNSLTKTETYFLQNHITTKNGKNFSRFTIKGILQNPVYMAADKDSFEYFNNLNVDVYANENDFNGRYGIIAYNKTLQKTGQANKVRDMNEWIIAIGKHKPIISGAGWVKTQALLEQNKSKSYRKPKSNVALLSGLLYCGNCGNYMRPKQSQRLNANGEKIYSYLCETKEKSRMHNCQMKNPNGNTLDKLVCEEIKKLSEDSSEFINQLKQTEKEFLSNNSEYNSQLDIYKNEYEENQKQIESLVMALAKSADMPAYDYINKEIAKLDCKNKELINKIDDLEKITGNNSMSATEFNLLEELLASFSKTFDVMSIEEKRAALRTFIERVVWDGEQVHIYLFGSEEKENLNNIIEDINTNSFDGCEEPQGGDCE